VRKMESIQNRDSNNFWSRRLWLRAALAALYLTLIPAAVWGQPPSQSTINKLALNAYCAEARTKAQPLADGSVSYKSVAEIASHRARAEYPKVYRDSSAWKAKIVALLDQYGDEPTSQLCSEDPGTHS
jgi:hypothetical protein